MILFVAPNTGFLFLSDELEVFAVGLLTVLAQRRAPAISATGISLP